MLCEGEVIGYFGKLAYDIQDELNMRTSAFILEMDLEKLSAWYGKKRVFESLNRFSEEKRDLALVMNKEHYLWTGRGMYPQSKQIHQGDQAVRCIRRRTDSGRKEEHGLYHHFCAEGRSL